MPMEQMCTIGTTQVKRVQPIILTLRLFNFYWGPKQSAVALDQPPDDGWVPD